LGETVLYLHHSINGEIIPFDINIDGSIDNEITIRFGQLIKNEDNLIIIEGIGRKIILKYKQGYVN